MKFNHAIIVGGGFSGILAVNLLVIYFKKVTLIERDNLNSSSMRKGIPQATHLHVLMQHGQQLLEQLMPGILSDLQEYDLQEIDWAKDTKWVGPFGPYPQYKSDVNTLSFSRVLLDAVMRKRLLALKNITILHGNLHSLNKTDDRVDTLLFVDNTNTIVTLTADLIVDSRGRSSNASELLTQLGYAVLPPRIVKTELGYASRAYRITSQQSQSFKQYYLQVRPGINTKGVVISPIEKQRMIVTALGLGSDKPRRNEMDFHRFLADFPHTELHDFLTTLEPESSISTYRNLLNCHYQFGGMKKWPAGLIVVGDGACVLNPVYGQGMTLALKHMMLLKSKMDKVLVGKQTTWEHQFQKKIDQLTALPWLMATSEDQRNQVNSTIPFHIRILHRYLDRILQLAVSQRDIHTLFTKIVHMMKNPCYLFHPLVLIRVFFYSKIQRKA